MLDPAAAISPCAGGSGVTGQREYVLRLIEAVAAPGRLRTTTAGCTIGIVRSPHRGGGTMQFIEQLFGVSPDGGSGALELAVLLVSLLLLLRAATRRGARRSRE